MKTENYKDLIQLAKVENGFWSVNEKAIELHQNLQEGEIIELEIVNNRDIKLHRAYFKLLSYIYDYLPEKFHRAVKKNNFYEWLKYASNEVEVLFSFKNGLQIIKPISISFSKMDNVAFKSYVKNQLPFIYTEVIGAFYNGEIYNNIIENIENEFEKMFNKLN